MKKARYKYLLDKSVSSCVAAIEVYNKPDFQFREEAFSVLMCTSWELLLKAKLLRENGNNLGAIVEKDFRICKNGNKSKKKHPKINRCGNPTTIGLVRAIEVIGNKGYRLEAKCKENLELLIEIRDNAVHFINKGASFAKNVQEVGTANLRNYMTLATEWFRYDFERFNFYLMPLSLFNAERVIESAVKSRRGSIQLQNLEKHIRTIAANFPYREDDTFNVVLSLSVKFVRTSDSAAIKVRTSGDSDAIPVAIKEEDFLERYPLDYESLVKKLTTKLVGFRRDAKFFTIKRQLETDKKLCMVRLLDPKKPKGQSKKYYSGEMLVKVAELLGSSA